MNYDALVWLEGATNGATLSAAILNAGVDGMASGWSVSPGTPTGMTIADGQNRLPFDVTVGAETFNEGSTLNKRIALLNSSGATYALHALDADRQMAWAGYIEFSSDTNYNDFDTYDPLVITNVIGRSVAFQWVNDNDGVHHAWIESANPGTTHSAQESFSNGVYWVSLWADFTAGTCGLRMTLVSSGDVVVDLTHTCDTNGDLFTHRFGNNETGNGAGTTYFELLGIIYGRASHIDLPVGEINTTTLNATTLTVG